MIIVIVLPTPSGPPMDPLIAAWVRQIALTHANRASAAADQAQAHAEAAKAAAEKADGSLRAESAKRDAVKAAQEARHAAEVSAEEADIAETASLEDEGCDVLQCAKYAAVFADRAERFANDAFLAASSVEAVTFSVVEIGAAPQS